MRGIVLRRFTRWRLCVAAVSLVSQAASSDEVVLILISWGKQGACPEKRHASQ